MVRALAPVLTVVAVIVVLWYAAAVMMNRAWVYDQAARDGVTVSFSEMVPLTMAQERPVLPAPHQVVSELAKATLFTAPTSKRKSMPPTAKMC